MSTTSSSPNVSAFNAWIGLLGPSEGVLSTDPHDPGNWTGNKVGVGELKGTKFGIAAGSHPDVDIASLTLASANQIRKEGYWDQVRGDEVPPSVAIMLAEAAYGSGPETAIKQMQAVVGTGEDGRFGPATMSKLLAYLARPSAFALPSGLYDFVTEFATQRLEFEEKTGIWQYDHLGWTRRVFHDVALALLYVSPPSAS